MTIAPTFNYLRDPVKGVSEAVVIQNQNNDKEPEKKIKKKRGKSGSSMGWGWFQGFNLFVTAGFLVLLIVLTYFFVGTDDRHEGLSKYILDRSNDMGMVMFNPQLPADIQKSFVYVAPVERPVNIEKPDLGEITLLSAVEPDKTTVDATLPKLELMSSVVDAEDEELAGLPSLTLESLQLEGAVVNGNEGVDPPQFRQVDINNLNNSAREAMMEGHLVEPISGSALESYQQILVLAPNHQFGLSGLAEIATLYYRRSEQAINLQNYSEALKSVELGLKAVPDDQRLNKLKDELTRLLQ